MERQEYSCCKCSQIKGFIIHIHELLHLPPLSQSFLLQMGNFLSSIPELSNQSLESGIIKGRDDVYDFNRILSIFTLTFVFHLNKGFGDELNRIPNCVTFTFIFLWDINVKCDFYFKIFFVG
jgi:hypothetical protein